MNRKKIRQFSIILFVEILTNIILLLIYSPPFSKQALVQVIIFSLVTTLLIDKWVLQNMGAS